MSNMPKMRMYDATQVENMRERLASYGMMMSHAHAEIMRLRKALIAASEIAEKYRANGMYDVSDDIRRAIKDAKP